jgi:spore germination protein YaaH
MRITDLSASLRSLRGGLSLVLVASLVAGCASSPATPSRSSATSGATASGSGTPSTGATGASGDGTGAATSSSPSAGPSAQPSASVDPSASATPVPSPTPSGSGTYDTAKFGFAAKGMSHEVIAFVTTGQLGYGADVLDLDVVSTIAFFSLEALGNGHLKLDGRWTAWNGAATDRLIANAHARGTKVVLSLARFAWSPGQTKIARDVLSTAERREQLARDTADVVAKRGVDGVNVDFEPIPRGMKANFTDFVRRMRIALDDIRPGFQLTFDVTGHHESYDVGGALRAGADAVYLMGYHYAGTWSKIAGSTSPLGGARYDVSDTITSLLREARPEQLIVGLPYYGHIWPTASSAIHSRTLSGGWDVQYKDSRLIAAEHGRRWDPREQVPWVLFQSRACSTCRMTWYQLFYDDAQSMTAKWNVIKKRRLLGTGMWTAAFEGGRRELTAAMRKAFLTVQ